MPSDEQLEGRRFHVGVILNADIVVERTFAPRSDVRIGSAADNDLVVADCGLESHALLTSGKYLHLVQGSRVHMCGPQGADRLIVEYEQHPSPIRIRVDKVNVTLRPGISVFVMYETTSNKIAWERIEERLRS